MRAHVEALFVHDADGRMTCVNEPGGKAAPRVFVGRTSAGRIVRFGHDVSDDVRREVETLLRAESDGDEHLEVPYGLNELESLLSRSAPVENRWTGPAYRFPSNIACPEAAVAVTTDNAQALLPKFNDWVGYVGNGPFAAVLVDGQAVSVCASVRVAPDAHEAGVETHEDFRGRGFACSAVGAWAAAARAAGVTPLYSTSWTNVASQAVAASLGLLRFGVDLHIR